MEDCVFSPATILGGQSQTNMDFDFMDELLLEGCWLETTDGSNLLQESSNFSAHPSYLWSTSEDNNSNSCAPLSQMNTQEEGQKSIFHGSSFTNGTHGKSLVTSESLSQDMLDVTGCSNQPENYSFEVSEIGRRWWIGPRANSGPSSSVMERLIRAFGYIKDSTKDKNILIQIWVPVNRGGKRVLTTNDQPFSLDPNCRSLVNYRDISVNYQFSAEKDSEESEGMPGRVFLGKVPEWTPDVQLFRSDEYPRVDYAQWCDVRGTLALPVFEQGSRTCLGVIEVVTTAQKIKPELESVCKALEAVDLSSSEVSSIQIEKPCGESYQAALPEILEVLKSACVTHKLPLAQTWVPCIQQGKGGCRHSDENYIHCVSTVDSACYVADPHIRGFQEACSEHHLLKGQGIAGRAFVTNQPCFSTDVTSFSKTEYPLSHHARMFSLHAAVAIRFRSVHTGAAEFVLEFFLPVDCQDPEEQKKMLTSLSNIIQQVCWSLRVVTDKELEEESVSPISELLVPLDGGTIGTENLEMDHTHSERNSPEELRWAAHFTEAQSGHNVMPLFQEEKPVEVLCAKSSEFGQHQQDSCFQISAEIVDYSTFGDGSFSSVSKTGEKRRVKAEKIITLQVLRQYFSGSLKDAAKSIGVCPTTLKRICRQHGIKRWPSRKLKKVDHSLQKLQRVINSVEGASGAFQISSFYANFPELASTSLPGTSPFSTSKLRNSLKPPSMQAEGGVLSPHAASKSRSSSYGQSSSSSHSCSSGIQQHPSTSSVACSEDTVVGENHVDGVLKRAKSDAELHANIQAGLKLLPKSQSHRSFSDNPNIDTLQSLPKRSDRICQGNSKRVKVTYGEEKVRFRMQTSWGFSNLLREIGRRFGIDDISEFQLKYLDDDSEWVLLTCDADLEECIDICRSSQNQIIKLALHVSHHRVGSFLGSSSPL